MEKHLIDEKLKEIFLSYRTIAIVGVVVLVIVSFAFSMLVGLGYLIGATLSGIAGYVGMLVSVQANVGRSRWGSRRGSHLKVVSGDGDFSVGLNDHIGRATGTALGVGGSEPQRRGASHISIYIKDGTASRGEAAR